MNRIILVCTALLATALTLGGGLLLTLYVLWPLLDEATLGESVQGVSDQGIASVAQWAVLGFFGLALGLGLMWHVRRGWNEQRSIGFRVSPLATLAAVLVFPLVLLAGVTILGWSDTPKGYLFPLSHLLAILIPGTVALGLAEWAGRGRPLPALRVRPGGLPGRDSHGERYGETLAQAVVGPPSWRRILGAVTWGLTGAAFLALVLEMLALVVILVVIFVVLALLGQGGAMQDWMSSIPTDPDITGMLDGSGARELFSNPLVLLALVAGFGGVVPVIEEVAKSLAVVLLRRRLTTPRDGFLYGAAAGVGFGMFENIFYNTESLSDWWTAASLRFGTILIHALATGVIGLSWYYALRRRNWRRGFGLALVAFAVHGLWNGSQIVIIAFSLQYGNSTDLLTMLREGNPGGWVMLTWTLLLSLGAALLLIVLPRRLARAGRSQPARLTAAPYLPATSSSAAAVDHHF
jgi:RsiW-degrading membrane proteinase PrsW (M82 family)